MLASANRMSLVRTPRRYRGRGARSRSRSRSRSSHGETSSRTLDDRLRKTTLLFVLTTSGAGALGCGGSAEPASAPHATQSSTERVFAAVVPSVVAVLNDDQEVRDDEAKRTLRDLGLEGHAPKSVIDVSLRKEPTPHGTGFMIEGGLVLTAAGSAARNRNHGPCGSASAAPGRPYAAGS